MFKKKMATLALALALSVSVVPSSFAATTGTSTDKTVKQEQNSVWKDQTATLKSQLVTLRTQEKALTAQIKALHDSNKLARKGLTKEAKAALKQSLNNLTQQIKAQHASIVSLRTQKQDQWIQVKAAKAAGNVNSGIDSLEQIISLKEQIIQLK